MPRQRRGDRGQSIGKKKKKKKKLKGTKRRKEKAHVLIRASMLDTPSCLVSNQSISRSIKLFANIDLISLACSSPNVVQNPTNPTNPRPFPAATAHKTIHHLTTSAIASSAPSPPPPKSVTAWKRKPRNMALSACVPAARIVEITARTMIGKCRRRVKANISLHLACGVSLSCWVLVVPMARVVDSPFSVRAC